MNKNYFTGVLVSNILAQQRVSSYFNYDFYKYETIVAILKASLSTNIIKATLISEYFANKSLTQVKKLKNKGAIWPSKFFYRRKPISIDIQKVFYICISIIFSLRKNIYIDVYKVFYRYTKVFYQCISVFKTIIKNPTTTFSSVVIYE